MVRRTTRRILRIPLTASIVFLGTTSGAGWTGARAAEPGAAAVDSMDPDSDGTPPPQPVSPPVARMESGILKFDALTIEGRIPRPRSIYHGDPDRPSFYDLLPEESFLPNILKSVEEDPF